MNNGKKSIKKDIKTEQDKIEKSGYYRYGILYPYKLGKLIMFFLYGSVRGLCLLLSIMCLVLAVFFSGIAKENIYSDYSDYVMRGIIRNER